MRLTRGTLLYSSLSTLTLGTLTYASLRPPQHPLMSSSPQDASPTIATSSNPLLLSDSLSAQRSLSIFSSLARGDHSASSTFSRNSGYTVVLAPINSAIKALDHRPWEDPEEVKALGDQGYKGEDGMGRAERNLRRWVQGCLVVGGASKEWKEGEKRQRGMEEGEKKDVWWEVRNGKQIVMPEGIEVQGVVSRVVNGEVWALNGTFGK